METPIRLHRPHKAQLAFKRSKAKRRVIVAGRRGGKTTGVADIAVEAMLVGRRVLEAAPTADQTTAFWDSCCRAMALAIDSKVCYKNETERRLELPNGGRIRAKTAWDADSLRGDYADLLILDEYSLMDPSAWDEVGAPMLLDNNGDAVFIFTPKRKNHAFQLYGRAIGDTTGRWEAFRFTSYDNPYLSQEALAEITADMTDESYRQEILAEFLDNDGVVFRNLAMAMLAPVYNHPSVHHGHRIIAGVDWGKQNDYTAISVGCATCRMEVARDRFNQIDYVVQRDRLRAMWELWRPRQILAEANAMGDPIIEVLLRERLPMIPFYTTATTKPPLIENLALTFERGEWHFQPDLVWTTELEAYERKVSQLGRSSYGAPAKFHDDTVIARALMVWQANQTGQASVNQVAVHNRGGRPNVKKNVRKVAA